LTVKESADLKKLSASLSDCSSKRPLILFTTIGMFFALIWYWKFHSLPLMQPDSLSYIEFSPIRTAGYPLFIGFIKAVFGTFQVLPVVHLLCLTLSATYLVFEFFSQTRGFLLACLLSVGLMINPAYEYAFNVLTEPLSISLLMMFLGTSIRLFQRPTLKTLTLLSVIVGMSIIVRPVHYAYVPVLFAIGLWGLSRHEFRFVPSLIRLFGPLILIVLLGCSAQYLKNGVFRLESMNAMNMIGKVSLLADKGIKSRHPQFLKGIADFAIPVRAYLNQTPTMQIQYLISAPYYDYFRYNYLPQLGRRLSLDNKIYNETSWDIFKARLPSYVEDVWINYCALWQLYDLMSTKEKKQLKDFIDSHEPSPYMRYPWYPMTENLGLKHHPIFVWGLRGCLLFVCFSGLVMILVGSSCLLRKKAIPPLVFIGAISALVVQGHFLLTALVQAGLPRYSFALWPAIVLGGIVVLQYGLQRGKGYYS
jgi:hypothetical protein